MASSTQCAIALDYSFGPALGFGAHLGASDTFYLRLKNADQDFGSAQIHTNEQFLLSLTSGIWMGI